MDTKNVASMTHMFSYCTVDGINLSSFDTQNVEDMSCMFYELNNHIDEIGINMKLDLHSFDTRNVKNMTHMFYGCVVAEIDLSSFDTRNVTEFKDMFKDCKAKVIKIGSGWTLPDSVFSNCNAKIIRC